MTKTSSAMFRTGVVAVLAAILQGYPAAQYGRPPDRYPPEWESDQFRVRRVAIPPGTQTADPGAADSILVFLTADLDGRMPRTEAIWQPAGPRVLENRGKVRFEAIVIEVKETGQPARGTPPEAIPSTDRIDISRLVDNPRVLVAKLRYAPVTSVDPMHFHPHDTLVLYLKGGSIWEVIEQSRDWYAWPFMRWAPTRRVDRGEADVVPANTFHAFGNAGGDPLEFLAVFVK
jgi:hypothetical protein